MSAVPENPAESDHEYLAESARNGDQEALGRLLQLMSPELEHFVRLHGAARLHPRESLHDLVQSICRECIEHVGEFSPRGAGSFRAWLRSIALHKLLSRQRHHLAAARNPAREERGSDVGDREPVAALLPRLPSPSQVAIGNEEAELLHRALGQLPDEQRQVVTMARLLGMSHAEIATVLGKSEPACRMLLRRGLVRLSALMVSCRDEA